MLRRSYVNKALMKPRLSKGVSTTALGITYGGAAFLALALAMSTDWYWSIPPIILGLAGHSVLAWAYKEDHRQFQILGKYSLLADEYHPHPRENLPSGFDRPVGFGRGVRM